MLNSLWHKILNDLWSNKARTLLVMLSIAVGIAGIGLSMHTHMVVSRELATTYTVASPSNLTLYTDPFDDDFVQVVRGQKEVRQAEGRHSLEVRIQVGQQEWRNLRLFALSDYNDIRLNKLWPERGAWPPRKQEVLIERAALAFLNRQVGDTVLIEMPGSKRQRELLIAGVVYDPNQPPAAMANMGYGYITFDTMEWLGEPRSFNELYVAVAGNSLDRAYIQHVASEVQDKVEESGRTVYGTQIPTPGKHPFDESFQPVAFILEAISLLTLLLSGFLVINTIMALLAQQVQQIGVMKAIGARGGQIINLYLILVFILGISALIMAIPTGIGGAFVSISALASFVNLNITDRSLPFWVLGIEIALGLLVPPLAALYPVLSGTRITVRQALGAKGLAPGHAGTSIINRLFGAKGKSVSRLLPRPLLLSFRNTFRSRGRLVLTLISLIMGGAVFMAIISVRTSLIFTFDDVFKYWQYDVGLVFRGSYRSERIVNKVLQVEGITSIESWSSTGTRRVRPDGNEGNSFTLYALPAESKMIRPLLLQGRWLLPGDEDALVLNTDVLREEADIKVGDRIKLKIKGREMTWEVVGITKGVLKGPLAYVNYPYFAHISHDAGQANILQIVTNQHDAAFQSKITKTLGEHLRVSGLRLSSASTTADERSRAAFQINFIVGFLLLVAILLGIVGGIGLMGTMGINVIERTREIGVLRAIGAADSDVWRVIIFEGIFIGILSWLVGIVAALPLSKFLSDQLGLAIMRVPLVHRFSLEGVLLWLVLVILIASLASFLPARNASRLTVREVLAYE